MVNRIFTTGVLRPRRFVVPLPTDHAVADTFTALFRDVALAPNALIVTTDGTDRRIPSVLGTIERIDWRPERAELSVEARCDMVMDHGVWVFYRLMTGLPDWLADRYEHLVGEYGKRHQAPGVHVEGGDWANAEPLREDMVIDRLLVPDTAGRDILTLDTPSVGTLTGIVLLPQDEVPPEKVNSVVAVRWSDAVLIHLPH